MQSGKIVYVLSDAAASKYAAMTAVSCATLRRIAPRHTIELVCDRPTANNLQASDHPLIRYVDQIHEVVAPDPLPLSASRFMKTSLRSIVRGDFIFLDSDAVPLRPFDELFSLKEDFAACLDLNASSRETSVLPEHVAQFEMMNWPAPTFYVNSGVFLARDTPATHDLFKTWHDSWLSYVRQGGYQDQPPLNRALSKCAVRVRLLPRAFNAMMLFSERSVHNSRIVHYFASQQGGLENTVFHDHVQFVLKHNAIDEEKIDSFLRDRYPWKGSDSIRRHWFSGQKLKAVLVAFSRLRLP